MRLIADLFDKVRPNFEKGGSLEFAEPLFEATESFLFTTDKVTEGKTHIRDYLETKRLMSMVVLAVVPCTLMAFYNTGLQRLLATGVANPSILKAMGIGAMVFFPLYIITLIAGGFWEVLFAIVRKHEINEGFLVTSLLFPLILPPTLPLWQAAIGISFGVVIGKEVFGGTGMNILNPALTARVFLFFTYPSNMSGDKVWILVDSAKDKLIDGFSGATPLAVAAAETGGNVVAALNKAGFTYSKLFFGLIPGSIGETSALACLIGAVILIWVGIASWRTMVGCILGATVVSTAFNFLAPASTNAMLSLPFYYHFVMGGFAFGTVFMATDPVSSATTSTGKWIYGILIGVLVVIIRCVNPAYPEGMMLAILLMNAFAPLIDHFVAEANIKGRKKRATE
ncbi:MAG: NADH:ubiquinone reductase (Na(+)-transporting) subunit B [Nitrospinota bacterium]|nr:NADH:ubiquinone reductase (Na(+)-transporting) subunit B [Nitrospinota bacterium]